MSPDLVILGNLLVDDVVFADGRTVMGAPGGATLYAALGAQLWGLRTGIVAVCGDDYPASALDALSARGVDLAGVRRTKGPGLRTWLLYEGRRRRVVHRLDGPTHAEASPLPADVPASWSAARAFHLAPMPLATQELLVDALSGREGALLSIDPYEIVREETLAAWRRLVSRVDAFFLSEDDVTLPGVLDDPRPALETLGAGRLRILAVKRGERGGLVRDVRAARWHEWPSAAVRVVDPTGAGDAFAAGYLAGWLRGEPAEQAARRGAVGASFAIEDWGPDGLLRATPAEAEARLAAWSPA
jgi:sugar/nucleoside kinase (ribokinase family)